MGTWIPWIPVLVAILAAIGAVVSAVASMKIKASLDRKSRIESDAYAQRLQVYRRVIIWIRAGSGVKETTNDLGIDLLTYASDEVVAAWTTLLDIALEERKLDKATHFEHVIALVHAIRKDAGQPGTKLSLAEANAALGIRPGRDLDALQRKHGTD